MRQLGAEPTLRFVEIDETVPHALPRNTPHGLVERSPFERDRDRVDSFANQSLATLLGQQEPVRVERHLHASPSEVPCNLVE